MSIKFINVFETSGIFKGKNTIYKLNMFQIVNLILENGLEKKIQINLLQVILRMKCGKGMYLNVEKNGKFYC